MRRQRGTLSAFVVCLLTALVAMVGLVNDAGSLLHWYSKTADLAQAAARVGAQEVKGVREGHPRLDGNRARSAALRHLEHEGQRASVVVSDGSVTVTLTGTQPFKFLGAFGVPAARVSVARSAHLVEG